ncbi:MAG: MCE family protein [Deltaproteobacteria bacterium]|nr:MCE family protein [Deltaproteobacteria bacterium]
MNRSTEIEVKVGIFVALGLGLIMMTILLLGGGQTLFERNLTFHAKFNQIEGLVEGAIVKVAGVKVGQVTKIQFIPNTGQVDVIFNVASKFHDVIHQDTTVGVQTQGMLGDRYVILSSGNSTAPPAQSGSELKSEAPKELKDYLTDADEVLDRLKNSLTHMESILGSFNKENRADTFFRNLSSLSTHVNDGTKGMHESMDHLRSIMSKIDKGEGTIGALVNDPALYDDVRSLLGGANRNRVLKYFIRKSVEESRDAAKEQPKK